MTQINSSILEEEINKFAQHAGDWWDLNGPLRTLLDLNPTRLQFIKEQINPLGKRVLDVGCGGGILSEALAKLGAIVTGIDAECAAINTATHHAKDSQLLIEYHCKPIEDYESNPFDVITCMELLEHVSEPKFVLEQCKRLLKPGGLLFVSTINRTLKAYAAAILAAEYILGLLPKQTHDYDKFIKPSELNAMARSLEFKCMEMSGVSYHPFTKKASLCQDIQVNYLMCFRNSLEV